MSDTSDAAGHLPVYQFAGVEDLRLPQGCELVAVEITEDAIDLPSFRHPARAAYVFGSERLSLSQPVLDRAAHVIRIPTRFSINVGMAGAITLYDRLLTHGRFAERPLLAGGPAADDIPPPNRWGAPITRRRTSKSA
jgi:tRNA G18 (ribose-2'-O)-methylase SpoU